VVGVFCEEESYRRLVLERFEALGLSGRVPLSDLDSKYFAKPLDSESSLLDFSKTERGILFFKFPGNIKTTPNK
jgi:hypothetical protein